MKKIITIALALVLALSLFAASAAATNSACTTCVTLDDRFACEVCTLHYNLAHGHIHQLIVLMGGNPRVMDHEQILPEFYGGAKFDTFFNLVVGINVNADDRDTPLYHAVREFIAVRNIIVEYTQYSSNEFAAVMEYMNAHWLADERPEISNYIGTFGLGFVHISVGFFEDYQEQFEMDELIAMFRETISDADMFEFEWSGRPIVWPLMPDSDQGSLQAWWLGHVLVAVSMAVALASIAISVVVLLRKRK